jgi:IS605 OrfB family transposase
VEWRPKNPSLAIPAVNSEVFSYKRLARELQKKYSSLKYNAWLRRRGIRRRIKSFHRKARNIIEDWAKKTSHEIVALAKQYQYAVAREDLTGLIENLSRLPKEHRISLLILSYRRLEQWIDWQCERQGVPVVAINPRGTSSTCPRCNSKLSENGYRIFKCPRCGFKADRDMVAVLNIERKAIKKMGGSLATPIAPQMTDVDPNRCGEPVSRSKETLAHQGGKKVSPSWL